MIFEMIVILIGQNPQVFGTKICFQNAPKVSKSIDG